MRWLEEFIAIETRGRLSMNTETRTWTEFGEKGTENDPWTAPDLSRARITHSPGRTWLGALLVVGLVAGFIILILPLLYALGHRVGPDTTRGDGDSNGSATAAPQGAETAGLLFPGWIQGGTNLTDYIAGTQAGVPGYATDAMFVRSTKAAPEGFSMAMKTVSAIAYRGRPATLTGTIRAENVVGWAGMWLRIDGPNDKPLGFDNMQDRPITGTQGARTYTVTMDVPLDAQTFAYGVLLTGAGKVWFDELRITPDVHASAASPSSPGSN